jgi:excisionase family DNA binding protein
MAKLLHVDRTTVSRWLNKGLIARAVRVKGSKQWRIPISAYEELIAKKDHESN